MLLSKNHSLYSTGFVHVQSLLFTSQRLAAELQRQMKPSIFDILYFDMFDTVFFYFEQGEPALLFHQMEVVFLTLQLGRR